MAMVDMFQVEPLQDSTDLLSQPKVFRHRAAEDGYLFFAGLLDPAKVLNLREQILLVCQSHGWTQEGTNSADGLANPNLTVVESGDPRWRAFYEDVQKLRDFHHLALDDNLIQVFEVLFGESVLPHSRNICRLVFPNTALHSTPPHQDNWHIGGSEETWTAWLPCGHCPVSLGSLVIAKGSHQHGKLAHKEASGPGGRQAEVEAKQTWVGGDYACGDVVILHSLTIHQGRDNLSGDRLRVSCDFRYQPMSHPVRVDSLMPHARLKWEEIYQDWDPNDKLKYYWQNWDLQIVERT